MNNTMRADPHIKGLLALAICLGLAAHGEASAQQTTVHDKGADTRSESLSARQQAVIPVAALAAVGDIARLGKALEAGLNAGLSVSDAKEVLVQVYAYAGFPRSLNALGELMRVLEARRARGINDAPGQPPRRPIPKGDALLAAGRANQTKLTGAPIRGALFEFAPSIDEYLKTHLFGDIFERDNLDWQMRELATVSMLAAMSGVEPQLRSHMRVSQNVGLSRSQLEQLADLLAKRVDADAAGRARAALAQPAVAPGSSR